MATLQSDNNEHTDDHEGELNALLDLVTSAPVTVGHFTNGGAKMGSRRVGRKTAEFESWQSSALVA
jgi:hypothetical protein